MENYDFTFSKSYPYMDTNVLKHKEVGNIMNIISGGRLRHFVKFNCFGVCEYDESDTQLNRCFVVAQDKFNRLRTNVLVYDVYDNDWSLGRYDKMFIFKNAHAKNPAFNVVFTNSKTDVSIHIPEIDYTYDSLVQNIMKTFNMMHMHKIFKFYAWPNNRSWIKIYKTQNF